MLPARRVSLWFAAFSFHVNPAQQERERVAPSADIMTSELCPRKCQHTVFRFRRVGADLRLVIATRSYACAAYAPFGFAGVASAVSTRVTPS